MKKVLTIALLAICFNVIAQDTSLPKIVNDTLITSIGWKIVIGKDIKTGYGSLPNGDFKTIGMNDGANIFFAANGDMPVQSIGKAWCNRLFSVKKFKKEGSDKRGYKYFVIINGGTMSRFKCDIEQAIVSNEVLVPDEFKPKPKPLVVEVKQQKSVADELLKLKSLLDQGILTKDEYEAQKKKLLDKN
jgi:hypothetical protein